MALSLRVTKHAAEYMALLILCVVLQIPQISAQQIAMSNLDINHYGATCAGATALHVCVIICVFSFA